MDTIIKEKIEETKTEKATRHLDVTKRIEEIRNKLYYLIGDIFPPKDFLIQCYSIKNTKLFYFYYPLRLWWAFYTGIDLLRQLLFYPLKKLAFWLKRKVVVGSSLSDP